MKLFIDNTGKLRSGWRILIFLIMLMAITAVVMVTVRTILGGLKKGSDLQFMLLALAATVAVVLARKYIDKKSFSSLGLKWDKFAMPDILSGILNSALVMAGTYFILLYTHLIEFNGFTWWMDAETSNASFQLFAIPVVLVVLFKLTLVAWWEELVFRGYLFQNLIDGIGLKWSIVLSSIVFGFGHFFNPNATLLSTFLIALITPQLIYAYLKTGRLWLPIGLHLGWNFFQAAIFGFASSGQHSPSLIAQTPGEPVWLSGGPFGAEGSLVILPFTLFSFVLIHYWVKHTRQPGQKVFQSAL
ncbi:MAG: type II CAAX endopeptidase family protein [Calditrichia bacterium]